MNDIADIPEEPRRSVVANPFGSSAAIVPSGALTAVEQQRGIAEVQARMVIARSHPRKPIQAVDQILLDCMRPSLAEKALYSYSRGGSDITGPTIRLAEAIAQRWGNIASGIKEISRQGQYSECIAYAWDLESGYYDERQYQVRHWRDTRQGGYVLTDERDIYELTANMGQRRKRAVLLTVIPGDVVEAAVNQCEDTLNTHADTSPEAITRILDAFDKFEVGTVQIEAKIQRRIDSIRPAQVVLLRKIYNSLRDGMSNPSDWFEAPGGAPAANGGVWGRVDAMHDAEQQKQAAAGGATTTQRRAGRKAPAKEPAADSAATDRGAAATSAGPETGLSGGGAGAAQQTDQGTSTSAGTPDTGAAVGASAPGATPSPGAVFSSWLVDGEGVAIEGTGVFTDPVAFATAYARARADMFPPERRPFERANAETLASAHELNPGGVEAALAPPPAAQPAQPAQTGARGPELPLDAPHDDSVIPKPPQPTRKAFIAFNAVLKGLVADASEIGLGHIGAVNAETINSMPNLYRVEAIGIIEARRKALVAAAAPATTKAAGTGSIVDDLLHDVYSLNKPESVTTWLNMDVTKQHMTELKTSDAAGWTRVMAAANSAFVKMRVEACKTSDEANALADDSMVDGALEWLFENASKEHDEIVAFSKKFAEGLK